MIDFVKNGSENGAVRPPVAGHGRMPGFGGCSPTSRSRPSSSTCGACDATLLAINWEPELRGILTVIIAVAMLCGSMYLVLGTNLGARLGFLVALTGLAGWMALMGGDLVDVRHRAQGPGADVGGRAGRTVLQEPERAAPGRRARGAGRRSSKGRVPRERGDVVRQQLEAEGWDDADGRPPRQFGQAGVGGERVPRRGGGVRGRRVRGHRRVRQRRRALSEVRRRARLPRVLAQAALRRGRGRAVRTDAHRARPRAGAARDRRDPAAPVRLHDPQPRRGASAGGVHLHRLEHRVPRAVLAAPPPRPGFVANRRTSRSRSRHAASVASRPDMGQYLPVVVLLVLAVLFGALSFVASRLLAPRRPSAAKEAPYECGIVPEPRAARAVPGQLLRRRDAVHHVRHRDHLPLPVRRRRGEFLGSVRLLGDRGLLGVFFLRSCTWSPAAPSTGVRCSGPQPRAPTPRSVARAHRRSTTIRRVGIEGRPDVARRRPGGRDGTRRRRARRRPRWARRTTSSPASSRISSTGPARAALAGLVRSGLLRDRDDGHGRRPLRPLPLRHGGVPGLAPPGRHHDRRRPRQPEDGTRAASGLRPDDGAQVGHLDGRVRLAPAACSTTTRSSRASTRSCPSTSTRPAARRRPRR